MAVKRHIPASMRPYVTARLPCREHEHKEWFRECEKCWNGAVREYLSKHPGACAPKDLPLDETIEAEYTNDFGEALGRTKGRPQLWVSILGVRIKGDEVEEDSKTDIIARNLSATLNLHAPRNGRTQAGATRLQIEVDLPLHTGEEGGRSLRSFALTVHPGNILLRAKKQPRHPLAKAKMHLITPPSNALIPDRKAGADSLVDRIAIRSQRFAIHLDLLSTGMERVCVAVWRRKSLLGYFFIPIEALVDGFGKSRDLAVSVPPLAELPMYHLATTTNRKAARQVIKSAVIRFPYFEPALPVAREKGPLSIFPGERVKLREGVQLEGVPSGSCGTVLRRRKSSPSSPASSPKGRNASQNSIVREKPAGALAAAVKGGIETVEEEKRKRAAEGEGGNDKTADPLPYNGDIGAAMRARDTEAIRLLMCARRATAPPSAKDAEAGAIRGKASEGKDDDSVPSFDVMFETLGSVGRKAEVRGTQIQRLWRPIHPVIRPGGAELSGEGLPKLYNPVKTYTVAPPLVESHFAGWSFKSGSSIDQHVVSIELHHDTGREAEEKVLGRLEITLGGRLAPVGSITDRWYPLQHPRNPTSRLLHPQPLIRVRIESRPAPAPLTCCVCYDEFLPDTAHYSCAMNPAGHSLCRGCFVDFVSSACDHYMGGEFPVRCAMGCGQLVPEDDIYGGTKRYWGGGTQRVLLPALEVKYLFHVRQQNFWRRFAREQRVVRRLNFLEEVNFPTRLHGSFCGPSYLAKSTLSPQERVKRAKQHRAFVAAMKARYKEFKKDHWMFSVCRSCGLCRRIYQLISETCHAAGNRRHTVDDDVRVLDVKRGHSIIPDWYFGGRNKDGLKIRVSKKASLLGIGGLCSASTSNVDIFVTEGVNSIGDEDKLLCHCKRVMVSTGKMEKIHTLILDSGIPMEPNKWYKVAIIQSGGEAYYMDRPSPSRQFFENGATVMVYDVRNPNGEDVLLELQVTRNDESNNGTSPSSGQLPSFFFMVPNEHQKKTMKADTEEKEEKEEKEGGKEEKYEKDLESKAAAPPLFVCVKKFNGVNDEVDSELLKLAPGDVVLCVRDKKLPGNLDHVQLVELADEEKNAVFLQEAERDAPRRGLYPGEMLRRVKEGTREHVRLVGVFDKLKIRYDKTLAETGFRLGKRKQRKGCGAKGAAALEEASLDSNLAAGGRVKPGLYVVRKGTPSSERKFLKESQVLDNLAIATGDIVEVVEPGSEPTSERPEAKDGCVIARKHPLMKFQRWWPGDSTIRLSNDYRAVMSIDGVRPTTTIAELRRKIASKIGSERRFVLSIGTKFVPPQLDDIPVAMVGVHPCLHNLVVQVIDKIKDYVPHKLPLASSDKLEAKSSLKLTDTTVRFLGPRPRSIAFHQCETCVFFQLRTVEDLVLAIMDVFETRTLYGYLIHEGRKIPLHIGPSSIVCGGTKRLGIDRKYAGISLDALCKEQSPVLQSILYIDLMARFEQVETDDVVAVKGRDEGKTVSHSTPKNCDVGWLPDPPRVDEVFTGPQITKFTPKDFILEGDILSSRRQYLYVSPVPLFGKFSLRLEFLRAKKSDDLLAEIGSQFGMS
eukprot:jgi/Bigna1/70788/fgenesh1_pg.13_\